jgi:hypothetical protein
MTCAQGILIDALGMADALWLPMRDPFAESWAAVWTLRRRYGTQGLPYRGGGSKESERALTACVNGGLVVRRRAARKTTGLRLTRKGLESAWSLTGDHPAGDVIVLDRCLELAPAGTWIPEVAFNGGRGWGDGHARELMRIEHAHLNALTAGLVESNCLMHGQVCYRVVAERPEGADEAIERDWPEADPEALEAYGRAFREALTWLGAQTNVSVGARGEIGELYLAPHQLLPYEAAERAGRRARSGANGHHASP